MISPEEVTRRRQQQRDGELDPLEQLIQGELLSASWNGGEHVVYLPVGTFRATLTELTLRVRMAGWEVRDGIDPANNRLFLAVTKPPGLC